MLWMVNCEAVPPVAVIVMYLMYVDQWFAGVPQVVNHQLSQLSGFGACLAPPESWKVHRTTTACTTHRPSLSDLQPTTTLTSPRELCIHNHNHNHNHNHLCHTTISSFCLLQAAASPQPPCRILFNLKTIRRHARTRYALPLGS